MELEIVEESRLEKTKKKDGATSESKKYQYKAEDDVGDIAATFKCVRRMFHVGEVIEFEITKTQEKLAYCPSCFSLGVSG